MIKKLIMRILICVFTFIFIITAFLFSCVALINYGPSEHARDLFVCSVLETSAAKFLATAFFSEAEIKEITAKNNITPAEGYSDVSLIFPKQTVVAYTTQAEGETYAPTETAPVALPVAPTESDIEVIDIHGATYRGKLMIVRDPSRVSVGVSGEFGGEHTGKTIVKTAKKYNAVAAVNGGRFEDKGGQGNGGTPQGIVMSDGELLWGNENSSYEIIGFTDGDVFVVGRMTPAEARSIGVRDAVSFGPVLIMNGEASVKTGTGSGLNPRTAIGQRADGAVLLLTIDGRQPSSLGASYGDLIDIMLEHGAVNAANLDGGNSTAMYYEGEIISENVSVGGMRDIPTCFIVR